MFYNVAQVIEGLRQDTDKMNLDDRAKDHVYRCLERVEGAIQACEREVSEQRTINVRPSHPSCGWPS
jgi:hypothetical protein